MKAKDILVLALLPLCSCAMDEPINIERSESVSDPNLITLAEALKNAEDEFKLVYGSQTRSGRNVASTEVLSQRTRSDENAMHGFYIVNYDQGFAMLSADRRRPFVYAISDSGSLHCSDTLNNKGLSWYMNEYALSLPRPDIPIHPVDSIIKPFDPPRPYIKEKTVISEALLTGFLSKFHQRSPYNKYCFTTSGDQAVVGCVPLAIGTVMGYYKWPESYKTYNFNYEYMYANPKCDSWARLFEVLGRGENANANYGIESTGAIIFPNVTRTFNNMGYNNADFSSFDKTKVDSELQSANPILCSGRASDGGHMWVIDGGYTIKETNQIGEGPAYFIESYYHCVWGWNILGNGYYLLDTVNYKIGGTPYERNDGEYGSSPVYNELDIVYGYRPNK